MTLLRLSDDLTKKVVNLFLQRGFDVFYDAARQHSHLELSTSIAAPTLRRAVTRFDY
jgi:hypothetical protein